jgi:hypothetical protein
VRPEFVADIGVVARATVFGALIGVVQLASAGAFAQQDSALPPVTVTCTNSSSDVAAINSALSSGGNIQIGPGTCQVGGSTINIVKSNTWLYGSGVGVTILQLPSGSSFSNAIIEANGPLSNIQLSALTIDGYNNTAADAANIFIQGVTGVSVNNIAITRMYGYFGIALQGVTNFNVSDNVCTLTTARTTQNECIIATQASQNQNGTIDRNVLVNSGMEIDGENIQIADNDISGWNFGGGITMGPAPYGNVTTLTFNNSIVDNQVHDSGMGPDSNSNYPDGLEIWSYNSTIVHNTAWNNAAAGIYVGGENDIVVGNVVHDNGQNNASMTGRSGIFIQYASNATPSAFGANGIIDRNSSWNTSGSSGPQNYALDINSSVTGTRVGSNNFGAGTVGLIAGPYSRGSTSYVLWHDFNGDNRSDILWSDTSGDLALWEMNGGTILNPSATGIGTVPPPWAVVGQRDFNGDGYADILWRNTTTGDVAIWEMDGTTILNPSTAGLGNVPTAWSIVGTGDFNGDGYADILWRNTSTGTVAIWEMDGTAILNQSASFVGNVPAYWSVVGTGDFNGDGYADILWRDTSGNVAIWEMNGTSILNQSAESVGNVSTSWSVVGTGDFNGDGYSDILWRDTSGNVAIWEMNGTSILNQGATFVGNMPTNWYVVETGDFNGDGKADILWRDTSGDIAIWYMNGTTLTFGASLGAIPNTFTIQGTNAD